MSGSMNRASSLTRIERRSASVFERGARAKKLLTLVLFRLIFFSVFARKFCLSIYFFSTRFFPPPPPKKRQPGSISYSLHV